MKTIKQYNSTQIPFLAIILGIIVAIVGCARVHAQPYPENTPEPFTAQVTWGASQAVSPPVATPTAETPTAVTITNYVTVPQFSAQEMGLIQQLYDATIGTTNGVFIVGAARKLTGNVNRAFVDYIYSFNDVAGLVIGYDTTWGTGRQTTANIVKGGINLKTKIYPFKNLGATNFFVTPFVSVLITSPLNGTSNNGGVGQLTVTGAAWEHEFNKNLSIDIGALYENTTGEGDGLNGNWLGILGGVHYRF